MMPRTCPKALVQANNGLPYAGFVPSAEALKDQENGCSSRTSDTLPAWAIGQLRRRIPVRRKMARAAEMAVTAVMVTTRDGPGEPPETGAGSASTNAATS